MSKVKLIWATSGAEELVAYMARVSNPENQENPDSQKLLRYLIKNKHWSPFEMVNVCVEINTTRDIARQILRHRSFSFQEFSQRYAVATMFEERETRLQDTKNRQNSLLNEDRELDNMWKRAQADVLSHATKVYQWALDNNIAKEVARAVLPEGMTQSRMYMNGSLRSWLHYIALRTEAGTQKEHRDIAEQCKTIIINLFPSIGEALNDL
jgi:thymidylate synthase (FAD)